MLERRWVKDVMIGHRIAGGSRTGGMAHPIKRCRHLAFLSPFIMASRTGRFIALTTNLEERALQEKPDSSEQSCKPSSQTDHRIPSEHYLLSDLPDEILIEMFIHCSFRRLDIAPLGTN